MRNCSMTPKLTPEPPCTATPAGLSMASKHSSSSKIANSRAGAHAATCSSIATALLAARSDVRSGGSRTASPVCKRAFADERPLLTRTSPLRMMR